MTKINKTVIVSGRFESETNFKTLGSLNRYLKDVRKNQVYHIKNGLERLGYKITQSGNIMPLDAKYYTSEHKSLTFESVGFKPQSITVKIIDNEQRDK